MREAGSQEHQGPALPLMERGRERVRYSPGTKEAKNSGNKEEEQKIDMVPWRQHMLLRVERAL
jgi:hypothetical protein